MHLPDAKAYCIACRFRREVCLCGEARPVAADFGLIVVIHEQESRKLSNTGHLAQLVVPGCRVLTQPAFGRGTVDLGELSATHASDGRPWRTVLFYPGLGATPLTPEYAAELRRPDASGAVPRLRLVIPDGTWKQARRMVKRLPALAALPRVILSDDPGFAEREAMRPRGNPAAFRVSTCEAIAAAFGQLGEPEAARELYRVYDEAALRIALLKGKLPLAAHRQVLRPNVV